jgi:hypothetical protein
VTRPKIKVEPIVLDALAKLLEFKKSFAVFHTSRVYITGIRKEEL